MNFNKFSTYRVVSIGSLKHTSIDLTPHSTAKQRAITTLMNIDLAEKDIATLKECVSTNTNPITNNKRNPDGNIKGPTKNSNAIVFPEFDISTKHVGSGNSHTRITTVAYEIRCHFDHANLLKSILIQASVLDHIPYSNNHIHFIPYSIIQTTDSSTVKTQII